MSGALIQAAPVERATDGSWFHPGMPLFDEGQNDEWCAWIAEQGLTVWRRLLEDEDLDHPAHVAYFDEGGGSYSAWEAAPPDGEGWFTLVIADTEDGPVWAWARREVQS